MLLKILFIGFFFGVLGTTVGGVIGILLKIKSNRVLSFILEFAAGLMLAVVSFDLIPESITLGNMMWSILFFIFGIAITILIEDIINKLKFVQSKEKNNTNKTNLIKTGLLVGIGLALHNLPEGLAIGSGFSASYKLGLSLAFVIAFHDIPEGISMAVPMYTGGMKAWKVLFFTFLSGVPTAIGAFIGMAIGNISSFAIAACLAFAAGTMAYVVSGDLIPESKNMYRGRFPIVRQYDGFYSRNFSSKYLIKKLQKSLTYKYLDDKI